VELLNEQVRAKKKEEESDGTAAVEIRVSPVARITAEVMSEEVAEYLDRLMDPEVDVPIFEAV
jgi:hypothetical protein